MFIQQSIFFWAGKILLVHVFFIPVPSICPDLLEISIWVPFLPLSIWSFILKSQELGFTDSVNFICSYIERFKLLLVSVLGFILEGILEERERERWMLFYNQRAFSPCLQTPN
uniref:Uncharacterized protein n=1 Tax=Opuntia streptacantha TaxID=393608 RepID=A0A7C9A6Q0_OPUST